MSWERIDPVLASQRFRIVTDGPADCANGAMLKTLMQGNAELRAGFLAGKFVAIVNAETGELFVGSPLEAAERAGREE